MTATTVRYSGLTVTEKYLTVHFTIGETAAKRFHQVKVSVAVLESMDAFIAALHKAAARRLREHWDLDEPMVLVPEGSDEGPPWS